MQVNAVKSKIQETECASLIYSGMYCSEPIPTIDENGMLVDNYFVFSRSSDAEYTYAPEVQFGIYTNLGKTAYINKLDQSLFGGDCFTEKFSSKDSMRSALSKYEEVYPAIRDCLYTDASKESAIMVREYLDCLKTISGDALYSFYTTLYPSFFEWAEKQTIK